MKLADCLEVGSTVEWCPICLKRGEHRPGMTACVGCSDAIDDAFPPSPESLAALVEPTEKGAKALRRFGIGVDEVVEADPDDGVVRCRYEVAGADGGVIDVDADGEGMTGITTGIWVGPEDEAELDRELLRRGYGALDAIGQGVFGFGHKSSGAADDVVCEPLEEFTVEMLAELDEDLQAVYYGGPAIRSAAARLRDVFSHSLIEYHDTGPGTVEHYERIAAQSSHEEAQGMARTRAAAADLIEALSVRYTGGCGVEHALLIEELDRYPAHGEALGRDSLRSWM